MVDVQTPQVATPEQAESSSEGLRRMQRLSEAARVKTNSHAGRFHPSSSALVYPPTSSRRHHVVTSVFGNVQPRAVPMSRFLQAAEAVEISPDGSWLTAIHAGGPTVRSDAGEGGRVVVYNSSVLDPATTLGSSMPLCNFPLSYPFLDMTYVYPPRTRMGSGGAEAAPALGPVPPPGHSAAKSRGPTLVVLTSELVYLFHPHPLPGNVTLDTQSSHSIPTGSVSATGSGATAPLNWTINALRCPLGARSYADIANPGPTTSSYHAERGWLGMVGDSDGVWAAVERNGELNIIRIDIGLDANNIPFLATTPLPALPRPRPPPFPDATAVPDAFLEHVVFVPLKKGTPNGSVDAEPSDPGVAVVRVYRDADCSGLPNTLPRLRTRFEQCELRHRAVTLVEGFKDLGPATDTGTPLDWVSSHAQTTSISPEGTTLLALTPLPDVPPHTLALALVSSSSGLALTYVNLVPQSEGDTDGTGPPRWHALTGEERVMDAAAAFGPTGEISLAASQGTRRGEMGLVGVFSSSTPRLVPSPRLGAPATPNETLKATAKRAARSVEIAVVQGVDWSDAVRAAFATVSPLEGPELAAAILDQALSIFIKHSRSYVPHILRLQVAVWALTDDPRRELSAELLRIAEASQAFYLCGEEKDGVVTFDLDSVWNLVDIYEWGLGVLSHTMRDAVAERAHSEWAPAEPRTEGSSRLLYIAHPLLRRILVHFIALLDAFAKFTVALDRPIRAPDSSLQGRSAPATAVAASRVQDAGARQGVGLRAWADYLAAVGKGARPSDADTCASLLRLDVGPIASLLPAALSSMPSSSALFAPSAAAEPVPRDGATCAPLGDRPTAVCDRCGVRTVLANNMRGDGPSPWAAWRRTWAAGCMCGGSWMRQHLDAPPGLRR
ncbi:hypothetical protein CspeluHIS016_0702960 [Cutaneotrichosporon spelunceum]|uniref:Mediator complex subunit 16 n=1 Tax=Cutaneotrichosporon spelunceum TaxID=1672016 RepID=A0AAD3TZ86_9TREE|nr:hypothetical protein CspeluHIS016_0702960 [Cutaneotrichosporon spelunceum]